MASNSPSPQNLRDELILLLELQLSALEGQTFGDLTPAQILLFEQRQERICELYNEVLARHSPAA